MKKILIVFTLLLFTISGISQDKYLTKTGHVTFEASVPSFEEVKATNNSTTVILNIENGQFAALVFVKGFRFKNALMEEHFNENYAESDNYPKANFKGEIIAFDINNINETKTKVYYNGTLEFHGKTKAVSNLPMTIYLSDNNEIVLSGTLKVNVEDFDIDIPKVVSNKVSKQVEIEYNFPLKKK